MEGGSSLHISFMCSQSISTLIKKVSTFNNAQSILLDSYVLLDLYLNRHGFQFVFNHVNVLVLAHALPTRISPCIASPIVTFLSSLSNSTSGVLTTSVGPVLLAA